ncbi:ATP-dependent helicase [Synechococcus sp. EJ6-Ellesmere]|uniref:ATP-dependent helicase n=1 Tax=Synechococcus sp. EJ6-Ellesmere TaxID=2823734 RepID=UPI0020CC54A9|nr:ATP-dependent helicase [Synechococcus sp. EJ6-Ellesmere]MCP9826274.1 ATP-dependent helicase [Synechococcus sp. EJ6-Ellesmere]
MQDYKEGLNAEQLAAVTSASPNIVVVAGAGTGKTKTMVARICHLLESGSAPERILAITFTRKAAAELVSRIAHYAGRDTGKRVNASTFHSWCSRIIANDAEGAYTIIDPEDQKDMMSMFRGRRPKEFPKAPELRSIYSFCRNSSKRLGDYIDQYLPKHKPYYEQIKQIFIDYQAAKRRQNLLDLDDVLDVVARNLENPDVAKAVGGSYDSVLVDEMQDTNPLQWRLLQPLVGHTRLFCVGDDAQAIYAFRGSDYRFIHDFTELVPDSEKLTLTQNYRSPNEFLGISNWLLRESSIDYGKELWSELGGAKPIMRVFSDPFEEAEYIADKILEDHGRGIPFRSNLILFRSSVWRKALDSALIKRRIPVTYYGGFSFLQARHVRDIVSTLRILHNPLDDIAWLRYLQIFPGIGSESASELILRLADLSVLAERITMLMTSEPKFIRPASAIQEISQRISNNIAGLIGDIATVLADEFTRLYRDEWPGRKADIPILQALAEREESVSTFLESYALNPFTEGFKKDNDPNTDHVIVSTIHSAKGLESDIVYVPALQVGHYPPSYTKSEDDYEEERRCLYVALTRAKVELNLSKALIASYQRIPKGSAYFLQDMPEYLVDLEVKHAESVKAPSLSLEIDASSYGIEF